MRKLLTLPHLGIAGTILLLSFSPVGPVCLILFILLEGWIHATSRIRLTPQALSIRGPGRKRTLWIPLDRILKIEVIQTQLDRVLRTGGLKLSFRGSRSMTLHAIPEPFELWKRVKIARWDSQRPT